MKDVENEGKCEKLIDMDTLKHQQVSGMSKANTTTKQKQTFSYDSFHSRRSVSFWKWWHRSSFWLIFSLKRGTGSPFKNRFPFRSAITQYQKLFEIYTIPTIETIRTSHVIMNAKCVFHSDTRAAINSLIKAFIQKYLFVFAPIPSAFMPCWEAKKPERNTW